MRRAGRLAALAAASCVTQLVDAGTVAGVGSPGGVLSVALTLDGEGRPAYSIARGGVAVVSDSHLGFLLTDAPQLVRGFALADARTRSFDETWEQPWGERRYVRNHYNELRARFVEKSASRREIDLTFRVFDDGVGFRYEFPDQPALHEVNIAEEVTEFAIVEPATAWWIPGGEPGSYEYLYYDPARRAQQGPHAGHACADLAGCTSRFTRRRWSTMPRCGCGAWQANA